MENTITKGKGGKWTLTTPDGVSEFDNAQAAQDADRAYMLAQLEALKTQLAAAQAGAAAARPSGPLDISITDKGQIRIYATDKRNFGKFPLITLHRDQFSLLVAEWPKIVDTFDASKANMTDVKTALDAYYAGKAK